MSTIPQGTSHNKHYTYSLSYPEDYPDLQKAGTVFYIGKGSRYNRIHEHDGETRRGGRSHKCNVIRQIWAHGYQVVKTVIAYFETNEEACLHEIALIFFLPGLTNLTGGGEGALGLSPSEESRRKRGDKLRGRTFSEESKRKISEALKGRTFSEEWYRKNKGINTGRKQTVETRRKISEAHKGRKKSAEHSRKIGEGHRGKTYPEEVRRRVSEATKRAMSSPETRQKISQANKGRIVPLEIRRKRGESIKRRLAQKKLAREMNSPVYQLRLFE